MNQASEGARSVAGAKAASARAKQPRPAEAGDAEVRELSPRRQRRRERNQLALREAARECFGRLGYVDATIAEITEAADVAHGTFYNYYKTKDEVFSDIVDELLDELFTSVRDVGEERSIRHRLELGIGGLLERCGAERGVMQALHQASHLNAVYEEKWTHFRGRLRLQVERDLDFLRRRHMAKDMPVAVVSTVITRMIEGVALEVIADPSADIAALSAATVDLYWDAVFRPVSGKDDISLT